MNYVFTIWFQIPKAQGFREVKNLIFNDLLNLIKF